VTELLGLVAGSGFAAGVNLYATALLLGLYGRWFDAASVPEQLTSTPVLVVAGVLTVVEFVADKIPWFDSVWDTVHTVVRPGGAALLAIALVGGDASTAGAAVGLGDAAAGGLAGTLAFTAHAAKASTRIAVNTSPEPFSNSIVSIAEDGLVAVVVWLAVQHPYWALGVVGVLTLLALALIVLLWRTVRSVRTRIRQRSLRDRMQEVRR
jgi:hypothetical protein